MFIYFSSNLLNAISNNWTIFSKKSDNKNLLNKHEKYETTHIL